MASRSHLEVTWASRAIGVALALDLGSTVRSVAMTE
jgi:hypothetical protein